MEISTLYNCFKECGCVTTDTRNCPEGSMFIALKGETFNGNAFARQALEKGCRYAVVDEPRYADAENIILVDDCLKTLQALAREHRRQMGTRIIGITGTNGKTTTKELIATVLQKRYKVLYTQGNLNNHIGVPLTLLGLKEEHELAVVEMGANHPGEIRTLVNIAEPDCGLITNVGKAHLEGFGSFEGVVKTKSELYDYLRSKENAFVFLDKDNDVLCQASAGLATIGYGMEN
ncbi:MAG: UDP-N-acetylmuramoyl-tripeptide--D-alanyl-D-alanine ligase, partial [Bacteroidaceae bacterium]|nr:UDP-N-acetylmuramoyl-tripeptide--D-alanyl-D-alanine ligase [Bacteroidaceae bacterium]